MKVHMQWIAGVSAAIVVGVLVYLGWAQLTDQVVVEYPIERNISYSFRIKNVSGSLIKKTEFWAYAPVRQTPTQKTLDIKASKKYMLEIDEQGNQRLIFALENIPPYATKTVTINVKLGMSATPNYLRPKDTSHLLKSEPYIEVDSPKIKKLSQTLRSENPRKTVESNYKWITQNLKDAGFVQNDRGALYALKTKSGDCTEYMYLLTALNRSSGIPTQGVSGFVVREDAVLKPSGYHNWAVTLIDDLWQTVDPHREIFMSNSADYIAMRMLGQHGKDASSNSQTLFGKGPGIDVKMN